MFPFFNKQFVFSFLFLFTGLLTHAQTYFGDKSLYSQEEINAFGALNYTKVTGHLFIYDAQNDNSQITDLTPLMGLKRSGKLTVECSYLTSLSGLDSLQSVSYWFNIRQAHALQSIEALSNLTSVGSLHIWKAFPLETLSGLENLTNVNEGLTLELNTGLTDISALSGLTQISGKLDIQSNVILENLDGLENIETIGGELVIFNNINLMSIEGLSGLNTVYSHVEIDNNIRLKSLDGLNNLNLANDLIIVSNDSLEFYCAINHLITVGGMFGTYTVSDNAYNPTVQDILDADCCVELGQLDITLSQLGSTIGANQTGASYQWLDCDNNYAAIPGATLNTFTSLVYGNFAVEIDYDGCLDTSLCTTINTFDITEPELSNTITLSPNPTSENIQIDLGVSKATHLRVFNALGQITHEKEIDSSVLDINLKGKSGIYTIEVYSNTFRKQFKVVKH